MKILFVYPHFWPDSPPYANLLRVLGAELTKRGHGVSMLTAQPSYKAEDRRKRSPARESLDGIEVTRLARLPFTARSPLAHALGRVLFPLRACLAVLAARLRGERQDIIVAATMPPVLNGLFALLAARLGGACFVYHLQDIYPEIGAAGGLWTVDSWRHRALLALDTFTTRRADRCVVLSEDMREALLERGLDGERIVVANNFMLSTFGESDTGTVPLEAAPTGGRRRLVFAGNLGRFQGLGRLLDAFIALDHERLDLELHFLGDGAMADSLRRRAGVDPRVHFHPHVPFGTAARLIGACDAGIVAVRENVHRYAYPSKTLTYLGLGLPVLAMIEPGSVLAEEVRRHRLGVVVEETSPAGIARAFEALSRYLDSDDADGCRIREHAARTSSASLALERWVSLLEEVCATGPAGAGRSGTRLSGLNARPLQAVPVIIIGAGRSGTNMLRDALTRLDGVVTWPCDEINYIWRHGNRAFGTDEFTASMATPEVVDYVRGRFASLASDSDLGSRPANARFIVEKTCANSLRVPFVDAVLPEARYIHLIRDGRDVVVSASERWKAPLDPGYLAAKARYVPPSDLPYYASRYFVNRVRKLFDPESRLSVWGPRFEGGRELATGHSLAYVCAAQWVRCVRLADAAFAAMPSEKVHRVRYEDFVRAPGESLVDIARFLDLPHDRTALSRACEAIGKASVERVRTAVREDADAFELMRETLVAHGYDVETKCPDRDIRSTTLVSGRLNRR